ncbi:MAG: winged helix-turn-helix domain-containing protein [Hyphomicrobiaceae bacterium]
MATRVLILDCRGESQGEFSLYQAGAAPQSHGAESVAAAMDDATATDALDVVLVRLPYSDLSWREFCANLFTNKNGEAAPFVVVAVNGKAVEAADISSAEISSSDVPLPALGIEALLGTLPTPHKLVVGSVELDLRTRQARRAGRKLRLGPTEFRLLACFMSHAGRLLSRQRIIELVWGERCEIDTRTVDVHIGRLRKALIRGSEADPVRTVRSEGYVFEVSVPERMSARRA